MGKILRKLFGVRMALLYLALFALAIGVATFVENDFGTSAAQKWIYKATWFEVLLILFAGALVQNILAYRLIQRKMWPVVLFHLSIIIILLGSAITRFTGFEGVMHIREGQTSNSFYSSESYINLSFFGATATPVTMHEPVLFSSLGSNHFERTYLLGDQEVKIEMVDFLPNPVEAVDPDENGRSAIQIVMGGSQGRMELWLFEGETKRFNGITFSTDPTVDADVWVLKDQNEWRFRSKYAMSTRVMATGSQDTLLPMQESSLKVRALYQNLEGGMSPFVFGQVQRSVQRSWVSERLKLENSSKLGLMMRVTIGDEVIEKMVIGQNGWISEPTSFEWKEGKVDISYGAKVRRLDFQIHLHDFEMERYAGTNSPMSYASEVQLIDPREGVDRPFRIYMNHILNYGGYRFFQSSYDRDERGTYLSVNHDEWGTWVSYLGYFLLTLGMIWTLFSKNTRFYDLSKRIRNRSKGLSTIALILIAGVTGQAQTRVDVHPAPSEDHADQFSRMLVQDMRGRVKPVHTLTREVMRKVHGSESFQGHSADAVLLGAFASPQDWYGAPLIKLGKVDSLNVWLGVEGKYAAYRDFFYEDGSYKLENRVQRANSVAEAEKGTLEKALIRVDERINIMNMVFSGTLFRMVPLIGDPNNTWVATHQHNADQQSEVATRFFPAYRQALQGAMSDGDHALAQALLVELDKFQRLHGANIIPSDAERSAEIWLNEAAPFNQLALIYTLLGLVFLILLFIQIFKPDLNMKWPLRVLLGLLILAFVYHTVGLGVRWYVSGRAPWSNGYESMIYIAWTTTLAGLLFARRSLGGLAATNVLGGVVLLIAMLSYLNPEITPLVPVLRSYWLTIHVSLVAGSYGFLMLGAVMGLINLLMMVIVNKGNVKRIRPLIKELSNRSEMTLIGGLFMLSVGTYLGGVWANESWGRYWGWDAKETWALVSILVYAFILHMRLIPGLKSLFAFNVATLFGLSSVIMTYFGVNYYLSGLHSYAAGDPVPIPMWVYYSVTAVTVVSLIAWRRSKAVKL